jgi:hypothetical protein
MRGKIISEFVQYYIYSEISFSTITSASTVNEQQCQFGMKNCKERISKMCSLQAHLSILVFSTVVKILIMDKIS